VPGIPPPVRWQWVDSTQGCFCILSMQGPLDCGEQPHAELQIMQVDGAAWANSIYHTSHVGVPGHLASGGFES